MATPDSGVPSKSLDMLLGSPRFINTHVTDDGRGTIVSPPEVAQGQGEVWLAGETLLKSGEVIASVFAIDTDRRGTLLSGWWRLGGQWYPANDPEALRALGRSRAEVTPWDWRYALPVVEDMYHD